MKKLLRSYLIAPAIDSMIKELAAYFGAKEKRKMAYSETIERSVRELHRRKIK